MKGLARLGLGLAVACLLAIPGSRVGAGDVVIDDAGQKGTYDCGGGAAVINTGDNVLTLKNCSRVVINGGDNRVDAGAAGSITVHGSGNSVTYTETAGRRTKIVNMGTENVVSPGTAAVVKKGGSDVEALGAALEGALAQAERGGKGEVSISADGTVRVEGSRGGAVEVKDGGITARAAKDIVVRENNRTENLDCAGGSASVDGNSGVLSLRGCRKVTVNGNGNKLEVEGATSISVLGNGNEIGWTPGPGGNAPAVSDLGKKNSVTRKN
jgi:hypothetical protein